MVSTLHYFIRNSSFFILCHCLVSGGAWKLAENPNGFSEVLGIKGANPSVSGIAVCLNTLTYVGLSDKVLLSKMGYNNYIWK